MLRDAYFGCDKLTKNKEMILSNRINESSRCENKSEKIISNCFERENESCR